VIWGNVNWQRLIQFLLAASAIAVFLQWLFKRSLSPASLWGYLGTATIVFSFGLVAINRWLWRLRVMKWRLFGWVTNMPDISGDWSVEMKPRWKRAEPFWSDATIRQNLFSVQVEIRRPASRSESLSASLYSTGENWWKLACVYKNEVGSEPQKDSVDHYGSLLLTIENPGGSNRMSGPYWTNKKTDIPLSRLLDLQNSQVALGQIQQGDPSRAAITVHATAGHAIFTRHTPDGSGDSANISPG
jgi:hypothetical protein